MLKTKFKLPIIAVFNIASIVSLILLNKWSFSCIQLACNALLLLQCLTTFLGLIVYERYNGFAVKSVKCDIIVLLGVLFSVVLLFANLSVKFNSVVSFQSIKSLSVPLLLFLRKNSNINDHKPLFLVILGISINLICDKNVNLTGLLTGSTFIVACFFYVYVLKKKQPEIRLDFLQLLYYQLPICSGFLFPLVVYYEIRTNFLLTHIWSLVDVAIISITCILTVTTVLAMDYCSKHTTYKHYSALKHLQWTLITIIGIYVFEDGVSLGQCLGIPLIIVGNFLEDYYQCFGEFLWLRNQSGKRRIV